MNLTKGCASSIAIFVSVIACIILIISISTNSKDSSEDKSDSANATSFVTTAEVTNPIIYEDDFFSIEYIKIYDIEDITTSYLQLKVTNKSQQKLKLRLDDVYVNDIVIQSGTALPIELEPGKISTTPFILFTGNTGLKAEDITKIEFTLKGLNDDYEADHVTDKIILTIGEKISAEIVPATEIADTILTNEE